MKKLLSLCAICLLMPLSLTAEDTKTIRKITVQDAAELAASNNISLKRQKLSLTGLEIKDKYSWNGISPSISLSGGYSGNIPYSEGQDYTQSWSISGSVNLTFTPALYTSIKNARLSFENGQITYDTLVRTTDLNVRKAFYSLLYSKENLALKERNLETARKNYVSNRDRYNRGQLSELNLLNSQYAYESQKPALESAQIAYENDISTFKQMLGIPQDTEIELSGSLEEYENIGDIIVEKQIEDLPDVQKLLKQIEISENNLLASKFSAWGPSLSAGYSYGGRINGGNYQTSGNSLSVNVRIPLDGFLPWSNGALSIETQKAALEDLQLQLENQKITSELAIQNTLKKIKQAKSQLNTLKTNISLAQRKYNATLTAYNHGGADYLTLQNASDALLSANLSRQAQLLTLISTILDLENMLGVPFGTLGFAK